MALFQQPLIDYSVAGLHFTTCSEPTVVVRAVVAQLSSYEYCLIVTKIVEGELCGSPPEVLSYALIGYGLQFDTVERTRTVAIHPGQVHAFSLCRSFSLQFDDECDFWGFTSALNEAKTAIANRLLDLGDKFKQVLEMVPTVPTTPVSVTPITADAAVATEA